MDLLKNSQVTEYISSLQGRSPYQYVATVCQCIEGNMPPKAHVQDAKPFSKNLAELAVNRSPKNQRSIVMYISLTSYFDGGTMQLLVGKMLDSKDCVTVEQYYSVLDQNLKFHPPCAHYMNTEYEHLILTPFKNCLGETTLWDYLIDYIRIINGSLLYEDNKVFDLAFKRCFSFCVCILQMDFEAKKKNSLRPLIMKCLNFNPERKTRMSNITKLLDQLFNTGYGFEMPVINLAILVNEMVRSK